jgi:murein L,D-transpeptidase YafK
MRFPATVCIIALALFGLFAGTGARASQHGVKTADHVVVLKRAHRLILYRGNRILKSYRIALGRNPVGPKTREGDGRTPEGDYVLDWRNPDSRFHRSIHISYPSAADAVAAERRGVSPGGDIMIHGLGRKRARFGASHALWDWTEGCIAVTDTEMDQIWRRVANGTPIEIRP